MIENLPVKKLIDLKKSLLVLNAALVFVIICLAAVISRQFTPDTIKKSLPPDIADKIKSAVILPDAVPISHYQNIFAAKNIFAPPRFNAAEAKNDAALNRPRLALAGIVIVGDRPLALIRDLENNLDFYCQGGEDISGYKVKEVTPKKVILEVDGQEIELQL